MIHVLCRAPSEGAELLVEALREEGAGARRARNKLPARAGDKIVCWGQSLSSFDLSTRGMTVFNGAPLRNKLEELTILHDAGVPTVQFSRHRPTTLEEWIPRRLHHQDSQDFIDPPTAPGFWTRRVEIQDEWRYHIFRGRSLRCARKLPLVAGPDHRPGANRLFEFHYSYVQGPVELRRIALRAVHELGLEFGAVDIIRTNGQRPLVLEVNRRPGLNPNTAARYAAAFLEG